MAIKVLVGTLTRWAILSVMTVSFSFAAALGTDNASYVHGKNDELRKFSGKVKEERVIHGKTGAAKYGKNLGIGWRKTTMTKEEYKETYGTPPGSRVYQKHRTEDVLPRINHLISLYYDGREGFYKTVPKIRETIVRLKDWLIPQLIAETKERMADFEKRYNDNDATAEIYSRCGTLAHIGTWKDLTVERRERCRKPCMCNPECFCITPAPCAASRTWSHLQSDVINVVRTGYYPFNISEVGYPGNGIQFDRYIRQAPESFVYAPGNIKFVPFCDLDIPNAAEYWKEQRKLVEVKVEQ